MDKILEQVMQIDYLKSYFALRKTGKKGLIVNNKSLFSRASWYPKKLASLRKDCLKLETSVEEMPELLSCLKCPDSCINSRSGVISSRGEGPIDVLFVSDYPRIEENDSLSPFSGVREEMLDKIIQGLGLNERKIATTLAIKCYSPEIENIDIMKKNCIGHLYNDIFRLNPKIIVAFGSIPTKIILSKDEKISRLNGKIQSVELIHNHMRRNFSVLPIFHLDYLSINPSMKKSSWEGLKKIPSFLRG